MTEMITLRADEILTRLFGVILDEARARPEFAEQLMAALPREVIARVEKTAAPKKKGAPRKKFNPYTFNAESVLAREGESALRTRLKSIKRREYLQLLADAQHIPVERSLFGDKNVKPDKIREAIVTGTKRRSAARFAAAS